MNRKQTLETLRSFGVAYYIGSNNQISLAGLKLGPVDLSGACLVDADLTGADLSTCQLTEVDLFGATYNQKTIWPPSFDPVNHGAKMI